MAWSGSGTFNRLMSWAADALAGLNISSSRMDTEFDNFKGGLENCITRDGQNQPTTNLPMGTFRHTTVGTASARDMYGQVGQIQDGGYIWGGSSGGTANALTISVTPAITAYLAGQTFRFRSSLANTGAATLAVNGLAAQAITKDGGVALVNGDIPVAAIIEVVYLGTEFRLSRPAPGTQLDIRDTSQVLPAGLWRLYSAGNTVLLVRNTAAAGDFSSAVNVYTIYGSNDSVVFTGTVAGAAATTSAQFTTKAQLDAKVYPVRIANSGTASIATGPAGWSVSRSGVGLTTITHNLNIATYAVTLTPSYTASGATAQIGTLTVNAFNVETRTSSVLTDMDYGVILARV